MPRTKPHPVYQPDSLLTALRGRLGEWLQSDQLAGSSHAARLGEDLHVNAVQLLLTATLTLLQTCIVFNYVQSNPS